MPQRPNTRVTRRHNLLASSAVKMRGPCQLRIVVENAPALTAELSCPHQLREGLNNSGRQERRVWFAQGGDRGGVGGLLIRDPVYARASVVGTCPWYVPPMSCYACACMLHRVANPQPKMKGQHFPALLWLPESYHLYIDRPPIHQYRKDQ